MPNNNDNNNIFDLPKENNNLPETNNPNNFQDEIPEQLDEQPQNIIEIPQSYYDKIAQEKIERENAEAKLQEEQKEQREASVAMQKILGMSLLNSIAIFGLLYATLNVDIKLFLGIPIIIILLSIFCAIKDKEASTYPQTILVGGIFCAVIAFLISMIKEDQADLYMYYSLATAIIGFIGMITSNMITKLITDYKNLKALPKLGYILFFIAIIAIPLYFEKNYHEEFYRILLHTQVEVKAETEEEFITKTIKNRYNINFTCDAKSIKNYVNEKSIRQKVRNNCSDDKGRKFSITSMAYNEGLNQYVVKDNYLDVLFLDDIKAKMIEKIKIATNAKDVSVSLYPKENCFFYGDCADCDEYYDRYAIENDIKEQYKKSSSLNFEKYISSNPNTFLNDHEFKYIINVKGSYGTEDFANVIDNTLNTLNDLGYKNSYGFIINIYRSIGAGSDTYNHLSYKVKGDATTSGKYENYVEEKTDLSKKNN